MRLLSVEESLVGVLQGLPRMLVTRLVILLTVMFRSGSVRVRSVVVQLRSSLMIFVMRSAIVSSGHQRLSICPDLLWASFASL
jgi:hypothetical protein